ncbi:major facilitator superfamily domain-containing protein [Aspergillus heterothallicus]
MTAQSDLENTVKVDPIKDYLLVQDSGEIGLIPVPAADPSDPLNWPRWRRWTILALLSLWFAACLLAQSYLSNIMPSLTAEWPHESSSNISLLITIITPVCAPSSLLFVALFNSFGRRLPLLLANSILLASLIWAACATSYSSFLGARVLQAIGTSPSDAIIYMLIQDISFIHERGVIMGVVLNCGYALFYILCISLPYMTTTPAHAGPYYVFIGMIVLCILGFYFIMPETQYDRISNPPAAAYMTRQQHRELKDALKDTPYPLAIQLRLWSGPAAGREGHILDIFHRIAYLAFDWRIWWCGLLNTTITGGMVAYTTYFAELLVSPPWSWPGSNIGLINLTGIFLAVWNWIFLGYGSDKLLIYMAKRSGGHTKPQHRLITLILPVCFGIAGLVGFGGLAEHYLNPHHHSQPHWFSLVVVHCLILMAFAGTLEVTFTYMISQTSAADALAAMTLVAIIRGDVSFGMSYGVDGFVAKCGYLVSFGVYGALLGVFGLMGVVVYSRGGKK